MGGAMNSAALRALFLLSAVVLVFANQPLCQQAKEAGGSTCRVFGADSKECHFIRETERRENCAGGVYSPVSMLSVEESDTPATTTTTDTASTTATTATTAATATTPAQPTGAQDGSVASQAYVCAAWDGTTLA